MAKRRDMYNQLAQRRADNVPICTAVQLKDFHVRFVPVEDVKRAGKVTKVASKVLCFARFAGFDDHFEASQIVEVEKDATAVEEIEKSLRPALVIAIADLVKSYSKALKAKEEASNG